MRKILFTDKEVSEQIQKEIQVIDVDYLLRLFSPVKYKLNVSMEVSEIPLEYTETVNKEVIKIVLGYLKESMPIIIKYQDIKEIHVKSKELFKLLETYRYRIFQLNKDKDNKSKVSAKFTLIEDLISLFEVKLSNLDEYTKVHHIGDIHGCFDTLQEFFKEGIKKDEMYIFTGDLLERGNKNIETLEFLISIRNLPNVLFIEGNHDTYLYQYANDLPIHSRSFKENMVKMLDESGISKKEIKKLCSKFIQYFAYEFEGKTVLVSHGGFTKFNIKEFNKLNANTLCRGIGGYKLDVDTIFNNHHAESNFYQVHGHRNNFMHPTVIGNSLNLEGGVENNGYLRVATFKKLEKRDDLK